MISSLYYLMARRPVDEELPPIYTAQLTKGSSIEERFEGGITSNLLRIGIFLSVAVMGGLGLALVVLHGGGLGHSLMDVADPSSRVNTASISIKTIIAGLQEWDGISFMLLGLVLLIIMPIAMVLINVVRFSLERDKWYTLFAVITLVNLLIALLVVPGLVPH